MAYPVSRAEAARLTMTNRERFRAVANFQPFDRLPVIEWATWWSQTLDRWRGEGLPPALNGSVAIAEHFGLDLYEQHWFPMWGQRPPTPHKDGVLVKTMDDYERVRPYLYPFPPPDEAAKFLRWAQEQRTGQKVFWFTLDGFFWFPRRLFGIEGHLLAFYDEPEVLHRINADLVAYHERIVDWLCALCQPDFMTFAEDMSYNHGSMLSKSMFDRFMRPYYKRIVPRLKERGIVTFVDSDGDITQPIAWFQEAGVQGVLPLERQAGVDVAELRALYPRMVFMGHFDKLTMHLGEAAMRAEFERLLPVAAQGGFFISVDHQTPPGVSYADYHVFLRLFRDYARAAGERSCGLPPATALR